MAIERFSWLIENELAGMARPGVDPSTFAQLKAAGVGAVVSLTVDPLPERLLREHDLAYLHLSVPNFAAPQPSQVNRFVEFCRRNEKDGRAVAVHCWAGCGRTGTMLACYLVWQGMAPRKAIRFVRRRRPCSIETPEQEEAVFEYAGRLATSKRGNGRNGS